MEHFSMFRENTHNLRNFQIILNKTNKQTKVRCADMWIGDNIL